MIDVIVNFLKNDTTIFFLEKYGIPTVVGIIIITISIEIIKAIPVLFQPENVEDPEYFISLKNVKTLREHLEKLNFSACPDFWNADAVELQACYDGIGPSKWSPKFRKFIAKALNVIEGSVLVHDYEWKNCDKTFFSFLMINFKLIANTIREAKYRNSWKIAPLGFLLALINVVFGWHIFKDDVI